MRYLLAVFGVLVIAIIAIIFLARQVTRPSTTTPKATNANTKLVDYASKDSSVSVTTRGKIVGDDQHKLVRVTVTPTDRTIDVIAGYEGTIERTQSYSNNTAAYNELLHALQNAGFMKSGKSSTSDNTGVCPLGKLYTFEVKEGDKSVSQVWTTSCGKDMPGNAAGNTALMRQLLEVQISDYSKQIGGVKL